MQPWLGCTAPSFPGGYSEREPPDPISNSEVKTFCADGSVSVGHVRVGRCQGLKPRSPVRVERAGLLSFLASYRNAGDPSAARRARFNGARLAEAARAPRRRPVRDRGRDERRQSVRVQGDRRMRPKIRALAVEREADGLVSSAGGWRWTMAKTGQPTRAQRSSEVRAKWGAHVAAWKATGGRQSDYCRAQGLDPKYFSIWKGRLERAAPAGVAPPTADTAATLVPVVIRASAPRRVIADRGSGEEVGLSVTLPNGMVLHFHVASAGALAPLLAALARLSC